MKLSKQDMFCEAQSVSKTVTAVSTNVLDFGAHGDDILFTLFIVILVVTAMDGDGTFDIVLESCDDAAFGSGVEDHVLASGLAEADLAAGVFAVKNAPLPKGLKRYQRLSFEPTLAEGETITTAPAFTAFLVDGRQEPLE